MTTALRFAACLLTFLAITGFTTCSREPQTMPETSPEAWVKAFNATDAPAFVSVYTRDCVVMPPNESTVEGQQGVLAVFNYALRQGFQVQVDNEETVVSGDVAYRRGTYEYKDRDGLSVEQGKYLQIWRKFDRDIWLLSRHAWSTDARPRIKPPQMIQ
jgi:ketosteroid isomerase-like protein